MERDDNQDKQDKVVLVHLVKTPIVHGIREWLIPFVTVMNDISCSLLVIPVPTF